MEPLSHPCRRDFLKWSGVAGLSWLTPVGHLLARAAEQKKEPARSVIMLWMGGGPSQLETFDPKPGTDIAAGTGAIATAVKGAQLASGFVQLAEQMQSVALVRSLTSKEGDHERGTYTLKTGFRPDISVTPGHPAIGAILCHAYPDDKLDIPRHISIHPGQWPARGGYLGDEFDAFKVYDPAQPVPDVTAPTTSDRFDQRLKDLQLVEDAFARGRRGRVETTQHQQSIDRARKMMSSEQLRAFDVKREPTAVQKAYGDTAFGRGCLAARRLIEAGVRCVEVTLDGWDTHANNHSFCKKQVAELDPAFAALVRDLREHDLFDRTVVMCVGEFGRTPKLNPLEGRDHWPHNFCAALAGGGIRGGVVIGESDPDGGKEPKNPQPVANLHATVLTALGINPRKLMQTAKERTVARTDKGKVIEALLP
jgi:uncharacterized protein (DUF1501 family)